MSDSGRKQKSLSLVGMRISALSWISLITTFILNVRIIVFLTGGFDHFPHVTIVLFAMYFAFACSLFTLARQSKFFIYSGIMLLLATSTDLLSWIGLWKYDMNIDHFIKVWPFCILFMPIFLALLSQGMMAIDKSPNDNLIHQWKRYRLTFIIIYAARFFLYQCAYALLGKNDLENEFSINSIVLLYGALTVVCDLLSLWQFFLLRYTVDEVKAYSEYSIK